MMNFYLLISCFNERIFHFFSKTFLNNIMNDSFSLCGFKWCFDKILIFINIYFLIWKISIFFILKFIFSKIKATISSIHLNSFNTIFILINLSDRRMNKLIITYINRILFNFLFCILYFIIIK
jgi:hypothetical protein